MGSCSGAWGSMQTAAYTAKVRWAQCSPHTAAAGNKFVKGARCSNLSADLNLMLGEAPAAEV